MTDCLAVLTTEVKTAFHLKNRVLVAFLDIAGNFLIDILCRELKKICVTSVRHDVGKAFLLFQWSGRGIYGHGL
jgi:hypothetical protein